MKKWDEKIKAYSLKNAIEHDGKAQEGSVISALFHEGLKKSEVGGVVGEVKKEVKRVNSLSLDEQEKEFGKYEKLVGKREGREGLPELPDAKKGKVIMRIAPSPSGPFHIGHALTSSISFLFVQRYGGIFYVRIEDTNPETIYKPAYEMIKKESNWLYDRKAKFVMQSDNMKIYYKYAEKLIKLKSSYVCTCTSDEFKTYISGKKACPCRNLQVKENLARWKKMLDKKGYKVGEAVLRFKSDMKHKNPAMRDFPLARINLTPHPLQKNKYKVWPLMNLAVTVDDIEEKMTHIIRAKEHRDNAERQKMIYKVLGKKYPWTAFLGRWHIKGLRFSTRQMRKDIEERKYSGWDDPKLPTIAAIMKQGKYKPEAFWKFAEQVGLNENDKIIDKKEFFRLLDQFNK